MFQSVIAVIAIVALQQHVVFTFDLKCNATTQLVTFILSPPSNNNNTFSKIKFFHKTPNQGDPWIEQGDCKLLEKHSLECDYNSTQSKGQNFRIDARYADGSDASKEIWYFDCFARHGVKTVTVRNVSWDRFDLKWTHYAVDENFIYEDKVVVSDASDSVVHSEDNAKAFSYKKGDELTSYKVCIKSTFFRFATDTTGTEKKELASKCVTVKTKKRYETDGDDTDLKTPLLAVGIGVLCLVLLCLLFFIYNKKCKQGGDHDYDMNRDDVLMGGEGGNGSGEGGEELQVYKDDGKDNEKMLEEA